MGIVADAHWMQISMIIVGTTCIDDTYLFNLENYVSSLYENIRNRPGLQSVLRQGNVAYGTDLRHARFRFRCLYILV